MSVNPWSGSGKETKSSISTDIDSGFRPLLRLSFAIGSLGTIILRKRRRDRQSHEDRPPRAVTFETRSIFSGG
jgi:hypothetical protein